MLLLCPPGVYRAQSDTDLLTEVPRLDDLASSRHVLDVGRGHWGGFARGVSGRGGVGDRGDLSRHDVATTWLNSRLHRAGVMVRRGISSPR